MVSSRASSTPGSPLLRAVGGAREHAADLALAAQVLAGERAAAGLFYDRCAGRVDATLFRLFGRRDAAHDDLVQTSFVQIVASLASYQGECALTTWATRVAAHVAFNTFRSRRRARAVFGPPNDGDPGRLPPDSIVAMRVREAVLELGAERSEAVVLHDLLGHDLAEIAVLLGITVAAAQSRLVRGRRDLRALLSDFEVSRGGSGSHG